MPKRRKALKVFNRSHTFSLALMGNKKFRTGVCICLSIYLKMGSACVTSLGSEFLDYLCSPFPVCVSSCLLMGSDHPALSELAETEACHSSLAAFWLRHLIWRDSGSDQEPSVSLCGSLKVSQKLSTKGSPCLQRHTLVCHWSWLVAVPSWFSAGFKAQKRY